MLKYRSINHKSRKTPAMKRIIYHYKYEDPEFGDVYIYNKKNVKNLIFNVVSQKLVVTTPIGYDDVKVKPHVEQLRPKLRKLLENNYTAQKTKYIDQHFRIDSDIFHFSIACDMHSQYKLTTQPELYSGEEKPSEDSVLKNYDVVLHCPQNIDFNGKNMQPWLESLIVNSIQEYARKLLPPTLFELSQQSGLLCEESSVGHAATRWGVCRRDGNYIKNSNLSRSILAKVDVGPITKEEYYPHKIVLSAYTALLPTHLMKFIILHELTHTRHPDHSDNFHQTLNLLTTSLLGLSEAECDRQIDCSYSTNIYCFSNISKG